MGRPVSHPLVLDAGALIAIEQGDRRIGVLLERTRELRQEIYIPAGVLAQVWRDGSRQARLARTVGARDVLVQDLTEAGARAAGELCGHRGTKDVIDASVVILARCLNATVASSDPADLRHLDPELVLVAI